MNAFQPMTECGTGMQAFNKYHTAAKERRTIDGITFASRAEMLRYCELKMLQRAGKISGLKLQPRFLLIPKTEHERACFYVADFEYEKDGAHIVEDVKGVKTAAYKIKRKLFRWKYPQYVFFENKV